MPTWAIVWLILLTIGILYSGNGSNNESLVQKILELEEKIEELESRLDDVEPDTYDEDDDY